MGYSDYPHPSAFHLHGDPIGMLLIRGIPVSPPEIRSLGLPLLGPGPDREAKERDAHPLPSKMVTNSGSVGCRPFPGPLIHSPFHTSSIVHEPNLELQLRGNSISAVLAEDDPKHRKE